MRIYVLVLLIIAASGTRAQENTCFYAGDAGNEAFHDVLQLSDGTFLVCGSADDLEWIDESVPRSLLPGEGINNALGTGKVGFIMRLSEDLQSIVEVAHFEDGAVEDIHFMKTTNIPGETTGHLFISGNTEDTYDNDGGYFLARLNNNFLDGTPDDLIWVRNVWAENYAKASHPWDVTSDARVYYVSGESHGYDWSAMYCLDQNGQRMVVENWRTHWKVGGGEWHGTPASDYPEGGEDGLTHSGIVFKIWNRCELRSWTQEEYDLLLPDGNGGTKKGKWPADFLFNGPCDPENPTGDGPGYTGYSPEACCPVWGASSVVVDRRTNDVFLGMNFKSYFNPEQTPDFEPAVIAMNEFGQIKWWSRLYHEITPEGVNTGSIPDQYVDALAVDYSLPPEQGFIVVGARAHGNNTENLWEGDVIDANPSAYGFQNRFTGTNGNIHESWIGKLKISDGTLMHSTYMAEYAEGAEGLGQPHSDPNLAGWPDPNSGWPDVNTTYIRKNAMKVSSDGSVIVLGQGRRTITTANAFQSMLLPGTGGFSSWNSFVRQYTPDLLKPIYSSLLVGQWDTLTQSGGDNVALFGVWKTADGLLIVGEHSGNPEEMPVANVPLWGQASYNGKSAVLAYFVSPELYNSDDGPSGTPDGVEEKPADQGMRIAPNPASQITEVFFPGISGRLIVRDVLGRVVYDGGVCTGSASFDCSLWKDGVYLLTVGYGAGELRSRLLVQHSSE